nr:SUKH-4 family immunity protein [Pyxidicoccus fallax]
MPLEKGLALARAEGLDLVLHGIPPGSSVARCWLRDISQYLYNDRFAPELEQRLANRARGPRLVAPAAPEDLGTRLPRWVQLEKLHELWGEGRRCLAAPAAWQLDLPEASKAYLALAGLPATFFSYSLEFGPEEMLRLDTFDALVRQADEVAFAEVLRRLARIPTDLDRGYDWPAGFKLARHRLLGRHLSVGALCVEEGSGAVVIVHTCDTDNRERVQLVNSSVELLGRFLYLGQSSLLERATPRRIRALRRLFTKLDPPAMRDADWGLWPTALEEWLSECEEP